MIAFVIDIESRRLYPDFAEVWTIVIRQVKSSRVLLLHPYLFTPEEIKRQIIDFIFSELPEGEIPYIIGHNYLGFDGWVLWKAFDISMQVGPDLMDGKPVKYFDTLYGSQFLLPDREDGHSLKSWGKRFGDEKIDYYNVALQLGVIKKGDPKGTEFRAWTPEMDVYCDKDTIIAESVFLLQLKEITDQGVIKQFSNGQKGFWLMQAQSFTGFKFDLPYARELAHIIRKMIQDIRSEVEPKLPSRKLKKTEQKNYIFPAKPFKQDGTFSENMKKFMNKHNGILLEDGRIELYGEIYNVIEKQEINLRPPISLDDQAELKDYFIEQGWVPTMWNYKKGKDKKKLKGPDGEPIPLSPKIQETQKICPNLLELEGDTVKLVVKFLSLKNRLSTLISSKNDSKGWINDSRLRYDGRISAGASGIASTHRWKHTKVVNVPKADVKVLLGTEFRSLWIAEKGMKIVAVDQSALEARVQGHFLFPFDKGKGATELLEGDIHCFSKDTEILTESGWKTFGELVNTDKVAQWEKGSISFVNPLEIIWKDYTGKMINVKGKKMSMSLTPNHRVLTTTSKSPNIYKDKFAEDLINTDSLLRIPSSGIYNSHGLSLSENDIKLLVAIQADGSLVKSSIRFTFIKERKIERLRNLLKSSNLSWSESFQERKSRKEIRFHIHSTDESKRLLEYLEDDKSFKPCFIKLNYNQRLVFLNELGHWDGTFTKNKDIVLDTTNEKIGKIIQAIAHISNLSCFVSSYNKKTSYGDCLIYRSYISYSKLPWYGLLKQTITKDFYNDKVGCVTVPSGYIVVRKNGCVFISGNSKNTKAFYPEETKDVDITVPGFNPDHFPKFKPYRSKSKNGYYAIIYGCSAPKLASTLGVEVTMGKTLLENFWGANPALKRLKDTVEKFWIEKGNKKFILGIDGRRLYSRSQHSLVNLLFQSTGAIVMDYALLLIHNKLGTLRIDHAGRPYYIYKDKIVRRIGYWHDETEFEAEEEIAQDIAEILEWAMVEAGKVLKLNIPLAGVAKIGDNWAETH